MVNWAPKVEAADSLVEVLMNSNSRLSVAWLNHYSLQRVNFQDLRSFDLVAIDGTFLQTHLWLRGRKVKRTSADLVLPKFLALSSQVTTAVILGGNPGAARIVRDKYEAARGSFDGYDQRLSFVEKTEENLAGVSHLIVGLGTPLQERVAQRISQMHPTLNILTCGAWIDQHAKSETYFPQWAHTFKIGWLIRIIKEPKVIIWRYTFWAIRFIATPGLIKRLEKELHDFEWNDFGLQRKSSEN
jgi:UDP-N-acetyl-D-mannosaminuronic acid transferase (WecB/TagA/CpsF family)